MKSPYYKIIAKTTGRDLTSFVTSFKFTESNDANDVLELNMVGVPKSFLEEEIIGEGTLLFFSFGYYQGSNSGQRLARITDIEYDYASMVSLVIKAIDLGIIMRKGKKNYSWEDISIKELVTAIAAKNGMTPDIQPAINGIDELDRKISFLPQVNETDFDVLKKALMVEGTGDFIITTHDDKIIIKPRGLSKESKRTFTYNDGKAPLISFKPQAKDTEKSEASVESNTSSIDPLTGNPIEEKATSEDKQSESKLGSKTIHYTLNGPENITNVLGRGVETPEIKNQLTRPVDSPTEAKVAAKKEKIEASLKDLTANAVIEGDPNIFSDDIITIANVAKKHSGNWYVFKSVHNIVGDGYKTTLELGKNAAEKSNDKSAATLPDANNTVGSDSAEPENNKVNVSKVHYRVDGKQEQKK